MRIMLCFLGMFLSVALASSNETMKDPICPSCNHESCDFGECYKDFVVMKCLPSFVSILTHYNNIERCTWDTIKRSYTEFTMCTELYADSLRVPWPNQLVEDIFVEIHATFFQDCLVTELYDPPPSIIFVLVMTPICLIPIMVTLVVLKTKNGDSTS
ncbi:receptor activity-modifying protein 2 isoform X2 [Brienomyrus brachyistius]|uniref:receptor activity-modifying protein 2 isoform X2 n=1 Tax=Brienomyrus brachyistius TaxID=42636 RepID=UPI0020B234FD|nr:receptor activity-modifying protein 2 isoform X2 [Brienomyrus brachyistius]